MQVLIMGSKLYNFAQESQIIVNRRKNYRQFNSFGCPLLTLTVFRKMTSPTQPAKKMKAKVSSLISILLDICYFGVENSTFSQLLAKPVQ